MGNTIIKFTFKHLKLLAEFRKNGILYDRGKALDKDLRRNIIQYIVQQGRDFVTAFFSGNFDFIARKHRIKYDTVRKVWRDFRRNGNTTF